MDGSRERNTLVPKSGTQQTKYYWECQAYALFSGTNVELVRCNSFSDASKKCIHRLIEQVIRKSGGKNPENEVGLLELCF